MDEILIMVLNAYKIKYLKIDKVRKGYRNSSYIITRTNGDKLNLIFYKKEAGILKKIQNANKIGSNLREAGLPVRYSIGKILKLKENYYACIYNYLPGSTIPWESYTMDHIKLLGEYLNKIHFYGQNFSSQNSVKEAELLKLIVGRVQNYFQNENVNFALSYKLGIKINFHKFLEKSEIFISQADMLNKTVNLHMDFVRGNILFENDPIRITGILDFEKTTIGSPIFDLARTLAFLIVDCKYKTEDEVRKYFFKSGYIKRGQYKLKSYKYLNEITLIYLIYDFYKFLKHNPYEFLNQNEHFIRTVTVLKDAKLLL